MALTNEVRLIGHCADAPMKIKTASGKILARVAVYTRHWWRDEAGFQKEQKEIHYCLFFGNNADRALKFLQKGTQIHLSGTLGASNHEIYVGHADDKPVSHANVKVQEFTVADRIMVSKEMYEKIFPGQVPYRAELSKQRYEMENFDEDAARIDRMAKMRGVKNEK
ncbi:MAG: single-stranded DNA-binding protein [Gammaproteobacteria bacterium]|nr:single-stranded DNA-binding protein [Gammaproteobacteria bacterium]